MTKTKSLITVASWEERFLLGTERLAGQHRLSAARVFYYDEYKEWTADNRNTVYKLLEEHGVDCEFVKISFGDPVQTWRSLYTELFVKRTENEEAVVDCSTMPRDTLWTTLSLLGQRGVDVSYVYHRPESYHSEWLSRDPGRPRLVYKLSGVATMGRPICLIITTGFDPDRTRQLMWYYEPRQILLGFQTGEQFENRRNNIERHREALKEEYREFDVKEFQVNAYAEDHGEAALSLQIELWRETHNIVMTSLGPKLGAVAMFRLHNKFPETALSYTPSREFNPKYSKGISESYSGVIEA